MRDRNKDLELLFAAGIEGQDATSQLDILYRHDDWSVSVIGHDSQRAVGVLTKAAREGRR